MTSITTNLLILLAFFMSCVAINGCTGSAKDVDPVIRKSIEQLEGVIGQPLPNDYRNWLASGRYDVPEESFYWVKPSDWGSGIDKFYTFGDEYNLIEEAKARSQWKIPSDLLLIAGDGMAGTYIALGVSGKRKSKVYYIDTTSTPYGKITGSDYVYEIGASFSSWLKILANNPDE